ncbi:MAG: hypothetical protein ACI4N1_03705 [Stenotrophomonas koreensis]|jgi:hypothetical protein|nr:hypothetical protein [Stenotrophomonas koreensis]KRG60689.1 hypothetical protein ABB25_00310 [Stenotrophomonas koreensis]
MDEAAQQQANQAQRQALEQALAAARQGQQPAQATPDAAQARPAQEQEQAQQLWLRRVPDEPGALLRRRLQLEKERRQWQR